jgi:hypothetical protein
VDKLTVRFLKSSYAFTTYGGSSRILTQEHVVEDGSGETTLRIGHDDLENLVNSVLVRFGRDWTKGRDKDAFTAATTRATDSTSIGKYKERKDDERFLWDFIDAANTTMATDGRDYWLSVLKDSARLPRGEVKLDQIEIINGDVIGLNFLTKLSSPTERFDGWDGTQKLLVESYGLKPGSPRDRRDTCMMLSLREVS